MPPRDGQDHSILSELPMCQVFVPRDNTGRKANVQSAGQDGFNLVNRNQMMKFHLRVRLRAPELAEGVYNHAMPGYRSGNADSKRTRFAMRNPLRAKLRLINVLQDTPRIGQKQLTRFVQSNSSRQSIEQGESKFFFQILNLARQGRLSHAQSLRGPPEMLLLSDTYEISQMAKLHRYLPGIGPIKKMSWTHETHYFTIWGEPVGLRAGGLHQKGLRCL